MNNHIQTLDAESPKSRRRIRTLLGLSKDTPVSILHVIGARQKAEAHEKTNRPKKSVKK